MFQNKKNKKNKKNNVNKADFDSDGVFASEFAHAGQQGNLLLSAALDNSALALSSEVVSSQTGVPLSRDQDFEAMNKRHFASLLSDQLRQPLLSVTKPKIDKNHVCVLRQQTVIAELDLGFMDQKAWDAQFKAIRAMLWQRDERAQEIFLQQSDILSFFGLIVPLNPQRMPWTMLLLSAFHDAVSAVEIAVKHRFGLMRPGSVCSDIMPIIQTPAHSAFPSGHATESYAFAALLGYLFFGGPQKQLLELAHRISENRVFAGVHYPIDEVGGALLGDVLAKELMSRLFGTDIPGCARSFDQAHVTLADVLPDFENATATPINVTQNLQGANPITTFLAQKVQAELKRI